MLSFLFCLQCPHLFKEYIEKIETRFKLKMPNIEFLVARLELKFFKSILISTINHAYWHLYGGAIKLSCSWRQPRLRFNFISTFMNRSICVWRDINLWRKIRTENMMFFFKAVERSDSCSRNHFAQHWEAIVHVIIQ